MIGKVPHLSEGKFKPDTYFYKWGDSKASLLKKMENEQNIIIESHWKNRKKNKFIKSIKKYWPDIVTREIHSDYCGIRTKICSNDFFIQDLSYQKLKGIINLFGIESPGVTSSMAISEYIFKFCFANIAKFNPREN